MCLRGASEVAEDVLKRIASPALRVYTVWLPVLQKDVEDRALEASETIRDPRATHHWNPDNALPREAARAMRIQNQVELAWDVFLLYGPDATWSGPTAFPVPSAWMHRLSEEDPRWMTTDKLRRAIEAMLPAASAAPAPRPRAPLAKPTPAAKPSPAAKPTASPARP